MNKTFFFKTLALFLLPVLIPVLILGSLSIIITNQYAADDFYKNNIKLFNQVDRNISLIFDEMNSLYIYFNHPSISARLKYILQEKNVTLENLRLLEAVQNYIDSPPIARPFIHSIYVYIRNNDGQFLASNNGMVRGSQFYDSSWLDTFQSQRASSNWTVSRWIKRYSFARADEVTTIYRTFLDNGKGGHDGVIALNIYNSYIEQLLHDIQNTPDQMLLILDNQNHILFHNRLVEGISEIFPGHTWGNSLQTIRFNGNEYLVSNSLSQTNGWRYISLSPKKSISSIPIRIRKITIMLIIFSSSIAITLTGFLTLNNTRLIRNIMAIFRTIEKGRPLSQIKGPVKNKEHSYIIQNLIKNFIEQNYLKVQLSEKKYKLQTAELLALQSQINPHFLFNTLETIYWKVLALTGKPNEANIMLEHLSDLLKYALDKPDQIIPAEKEIRYTKSYIEILKIRFHNQFNCIWEYDEKSVYSKGILKLLLQPLIENSIYHGFKTKESPGCIKIKLQADAKLMRLTVIDNGVGISKDELSSILNRMQTETDEIGHIGLTNTDKRLKLTFGPSYGIRLRSKSGFGTVVVVTWPI